MKKTFLLCVFVLAVSAFSAFGQQMSKDEKAIRDTLNMTAEGWNKGDLNQYLSAYVKEATEMLSNGPAGGVEAIEKTMKEGFWKSGRPDRTGWFTTVWTKTKTGWKMIHDHS